MRERFAHLSYMHQGSIVSVTALLAHLSQMHQDPTVGATELLTSPIPALYHIDPISLISPICTPPIFNWIS